MGKSGGAHGKGMSRMPASAVIRGAGVPVRQRVSAAEWAARTELAALYRMIHHFGMTDLIANHITMRVPGEDDHILINAYGLMYDEITASNLYKITLDGDVVLTSPMWTLAST